VEKLHLKLKERQAYYLLFSLFEIFLRVRCA